VPRRNEQEPLPNYRFKVFLEGVLRMPMSKRAWKEEDIAKLKAMAGKVPSQRIAAELGRSHGALAVEACKLGVSLRTVPRGHRAKADADGPMAASVS
jgi:hypothetical protein